VTDLFAPPMGDLAYPEPPNPAELDAALATAGAMRTLDRNAKVVDPLIPPRDRLLKGARLIAGNQGADREPYRQWRQDRTQPTPPRSGTDVRQGNVLAAKDNLERGKVLSRNGLRSPHNPERSASGETGDEPAGTRIAAWLEATKPDPIDVARFDRAEKMGRAAALWDKMHAGRLDDDEAFQLSDLVTKTGQILDDFDDDLTVGKGSVVDVGDRVRVHWEEEPAPGVVTALGLGTLPIDAFDGDTETGFDTLVGDDIVVAAPATSQTTLRRAFPAASTGGTPRWLTVQPTVVRGLLRAVDSAGIDPKAHVSVHLAGHPGLAPFDSLTFTTATTRRVDRLRRLGAEHLGRGLVAAPRLLRRPVTADELVDEPTMDEFVGSTAWAIFDPADTISAKEHHQIPVRSGDRDLVMVFGIGPDEAAEATSGFAYTNDGIAIQPGYDGLEPYEDEPVWFEVKLRNGREYRFPASQDEALLYSDRVQRPVDRWQIPNPDRARLEGLAAHLEQLDAQDVAAYVAGNAGSGFTEAREVLWGDGTGAVASSRALGLRSGPNVIPVWLRRSDGLPDDTAVSSDLLDTSEAEGGAVQVGSKWQIDAKGVPDLADAVRKGHALAAKYGYENVEVLTDRGKLSLT
jgi:hypothetical protein